MIVRRRLNDTNYVLQKSTNSWPFVIHIDHMQKLPNGLTEKEGVKDPHLLPTRPQACRLCDRLTICQSQSGLSDHTTMYHGSWYRYSACGDLLVPIPEGELEAKPRKVRDGQVHRRHCTDPPGASWDAGIGPKVGLPVKPPSKGRCHSRRTRV